MKLDMHCHVREGSPDSRVTIEDYIARLKELGFDGMLVTDHDTYNGYRHWKNHIKGQDDFVVLKGVEYDTIDAGHIICIMPEGVKMRTLEVRGLPLQVLIDFVHRHGGILGPAHPCGGRYLSYTNAKSYFKSPELVEQFDFFEEFNACESPESNAGAKSLVEKYGKPGIGGSDAHRPETVGMAYTVLPRKVTTESELIELIKNKETTVATGDFFSGTTKNKMGKAGNIYDYSFWIYNKSLEVLRRNKRNTLHDKENPIDK